MGLRLMRRQQRNHTPDMKPTTPIGINGLCSEEEEFPIKKTKIPMG
jgi:hypothetical protein